MLAPNTQLGAPNYYISERHCNRSNRIQIDDAALVDKHEGGGVALDEQWGQVGVHKGAAGG